MKKTFIAILLLIIIAIAIGRYLYNSPTKETNQHLQKSEDQKEIEVEKTEKEKISKEEKEFNESGRVKAMKCRMSFIKDL
ncbi:MAG: hypothetical protein KAQ64_02425 [Candidatus Pacebacteria bacterium]|nr:hypothetical protein [Candidatus Paceibacterota bacterium]